MTETRVRRDKRRQRDTDHTEKENTKSSKQETTETGTGGEKGVITFCEQDRQVGAFRRWVAGNTDTSPTLGAPRHRVKER